MQAKEKVGYWYYLEKLEAKHTDEPPTSFFTLAYNITGKIEFAERALKTASRKIKIAIWLNYCIKICLKFTLQKH